MPASGGTFMLLDEHAQNAAISLAAMLTFTMLNPFIGAASVRALCDDRLRSKCEISLGTSGCQ